MKARFLFLIIVVVLISACSSITNPVPAHLKLTPYFTPTEPQPQQTQAVSSTPFTAPTPTPTIHVVAAGETMSSVALRYGVETAAVMAANPQVNPNAMTLGTKLTIPSQSGAGFDGSNATPVPMTIGPLNCIRSREGGVWCFLLVKNEQNFPVENIIVHILLGNSQTGQVLDQLTTAPLNILYPDKALAISVYFSAAMPEPFQTSYELVSALQVQDGSSRYLETKVENQQINIDSNGLSVRIYGEVSLTDSSASANQVWAAAFAFDAQGRIVGLRRWESVAPLPVGQKISFSFQVYSTGAAIASVEILVEARK
jgi:LysM repeat protein